MSITTTGTTGTEGTGPPGVPGIDVPAVTAWCATSVAAVAPLAFTRVGTGRSNLTFRVDDGAGRSFILRRPPLGPLLAKAHDMEREYRVLMAMKRAGVRVPRPLAVCADPEVNEHPFYVMERIEGTVVDARAAAEPFAPAARRRMGLALMESLAKIHAVDVDEWGLGDLGPRENFVERQLRRMRRQWEASRDGDLPLIDELADRLAAAAPDQTSVSLVHGDFRLGNVMVDAAGEIVAALDWELCALGEPLADLGHLLAFWSDPGETVPLDDGSLDLPGYVSRRELVEHYGRVSGRDVSAVDYFLALALWKLAVITQGVLVRERRSNANAGRAPVPDVPPVEVLAEEARAACVSGGFW